MEAVRSWKTWYTRHGDGLEDKMMEKVKDYLDTAAGIKKGIKQQSWMGFGMLHLANNGRAALYWLLAFVVCLLTWVYAWVEDFPGDVRYGVME
ncbi:hypothetical protein Q9L58_005643 [Maublancomyces gigas]|uniref:Uncharacterized protein n=1 Tax=Discina gigas TaxID=1032678 RepID=A0ABR3GHP4_9PEZI